ISIFFITLIILLKKPLHNRYNRLFNKNMEFALNATGTVGIEPAYPVVVSTRCTAIRLQNNKFDCS
ncbi:TPA: hypothetical protein ACSBSP_001774, partial [Streptococcus pyogenes]